MSEHLDALASRGITGRDAETALAAFRRQVANDEPLSSDTIRVAEALASVYWRKLNPYPVPGIDFPL